MRLASRVIMHRQNNQLTDQISKARRGLVAGWGFSIKEPDQATAAKCEAPLVEGTFHYLGVEVDDTGDHEKARNGSPTS